MHVTNRFWLALLSTFVYGISFAGESELKQFCRDNFEDYTFIDGFTLGRKDECVPADPCSSKDVDVHNKYCIKTIDDIDPEIDPSLRVSYNINGKSCSMKIMRDTGESVDISNCEYVGLTPGTWMWRIPYGTVKGEALCSAQKAVDIKQIEYSGADKKVWTYDTEKLKTASGDKKYCWCKANGLYTLMTDKKPKMEFEKGPWVYIANEEREDFCDMDCAGKCESATKDADKYALFFGKNYKIPNRIKETKATKFCTENFDNYTYVKEKDICIPSNVCSLSDKDIHDNYCIKSIDEIDYRIDGTHSRAFIQQIPLGRVEHTYEICRITLLGSSEATWFGSDCSSVGLKYYEWLVRFPYGTIKGESLCSGQSGGVVKGEYGAGSKKVWTKDEKKLREASGDKKYCWCKANALYDLMSDTKPKSEFKESIWGFAFESYDADTCDLNCTMNCAREVERIPNFRTAVFFGK